MPTIVGFDKSLCDITIIKDNHQSKGLFFVANATQLVDDEGLPLERHGEIIYQEFPLKCKWTSDTG